MIIMLYKNDYYVFFVVNDLKFVMLYENFVIN
jgi:hypothetical protein